MVAQQWLRTQYGPRSLDGFMFSVRAFMCVCVCASKTKSKVLIKAWVTQVEQTWVWILATCCRILRPLLVSLTLSPLQ